MAAPRARAALLAPLIPAIVLAGCMVEGGSGKQSLPAGPIRRDPAAPRASLTIAYGSSIEQHVLAAIYAEALRAAGYRADTAASPDPRGGLGRVEADAYPERARAARTVRGVISSAETPYDSGWAVASPRRVATKLHLRTLSDLAGQAREATVSVPRGCQRRRDCLPALEREYDAHFGRVITVRPDVRHEPLKHRKARAGVVGSIDPQLIRNGLVLLTDDRHAFPRAGWVLLVRKQALGGGEAPERIAAVADRAVQSLTPEVMQELVARVAFDERPASQVARQYLTRSRLVR